MHHNTLRLVTRRSSCATLRVAARPTSVGLAVAVVTCLLLFALVGHASAQPPVQQTEEEKRLSDEFPRVELVTMGVGSLAWERHGHIALCIEYENPRENACYNYGIGDFHHPLGMAWGFFRGNGSFWVGKMNPREMLGIYQYADRTIWVQKLPLTQPQKKQVIDKLEYDILEEHKYYSYDHFWDNCTTRVRDILDDATDHALHKMTLETDDRTYRTLAREGFYGMPLFLIITDLAMGRVTDRVPSYWERMFLPDYLREAAIPLWHSEPIAIYTRKGPPALKEIEKRLANPSISPAERADLEQHMEDLKTGPTGRLMFCFIIILLTAPAWATRLWGRFQRTGLAVAVVPTVFLGLVFWGLAIISPLPYVRWNESCLAMLPADLLLLFLAGERRRKYALGRVAMLGLMAVLLLVNVLKQPIWPALLWALIPNAVVAFMPEKPAKTALAAATAKYAQKPAAKR